MKNKLKTGLIVGVFLFVLAAMVIPGILLENGKADAISETEGKSVAGTQTMEYEGRNKRMTKEDWKIKTILLVENTDVSGCEDKEIGRISEVQEEYIKRIENAETSDRVAHIYYNYKKKVMDISGGKVRVPENDFGSECHMKKR
jgi:preprotein translocase subunit SecG